MDYSIYALLARASYCKDSDGIILNFKEKAEASLTTLKRQYDALDNWEVVYADKALLGFQ